jgi:hypothetical protein
MARYQLERDGSFYSIRDLVKDELVKHRTLEVPERFRTQLRAQRRLMQLEELAEDRGGGSWMPFPRRC